MKIIKIITSVISYILFQILFLVISGIISRVAAILVLFFSRPAGPSAFAAGVAALLLGWVAGIVAYIVQNLIFIRSKYNKLSGSLKYLFLLILIVLIFLHFFGPYLYKRSLLPN